MFTAERARSDTVSCAKLGHRRLRLLHKGKNLTSKPLCVVGEDGKDKLSGFAVMSHPSPIPLAGARSSALSPLHPSLFPVQTSSSHPCLSPAFCSCQLGLSCQHA